MEDILIAGGGVLLSVVSCYGLYQAAKYAMWYIKQSKYI